MVTTLMFNTFQIPRASWRKSGNKEGAKVASKLDHFVPNHPYLEQLESNCGYFKRHWNARNRPTTFMNTSKPKSHCRRPYIPEKQPIDMLTKHHVTPQAWGCVPISKSTLNWS